MEFFDLDDKTFGLRLEVFALRQGVDPAVSSVFLLAGDGTLTFSNGHAANDLSQGTTVRRAINGRLKFLDLRAQSVLDLALRKLPADPIVLQINAETVPLDARIVSFDGNGFGLSDDDIHLRPRLAVFLSQPREQGYLVDQMTSLWGLSHSEAVIALSLADGKTSNEIARDRGVSIHTVRNQLKSALSKVDARRQAELVAMVERLRHI